MKKYLFLLSLLFLVGCSTSGNEDEIWDTINNQEYSALNGWAGVGIYFYEKDSIKYCDYMIYGSGVPVVALITSEIQFESDDKLVISIPSGFLDATDTSTQYTEMIFIYSWEENTFTLNALVFEDRDWDLRQMCIDSGYCEYFLSEEE